MQKNDEFEIEITDLSEDGAGIGRLDTYIWFIKDTVPGDRVRASVLKMKKNYGFARLKEVLTPSSDRVEAVCPAARACGGCTLQEMRYEAQLAFKEKKVRSALERIGGFDLEGLEAVGQLLFEPIIGMEEPLRYRNKMQFPVGKNKRGELTAGFYAGHTHCIIECEDCRTGAYENGPVLRRVLEWMKENGIDAYDEMTRKGVVRHILIRIGRRTGEILVCLVINGDGLKNTRTLAERLMALSFDSGLHVTQISLSVNKTASNVIMGDRIINVAGPGYITDRIRRPDGREISFRISAPAFYQVNSLQMEKLYAKAYEYAEPAEGEVLWDLYCGIGTLSLYYADRFKKVRGVEIVPEAVENALVNAAENGFDNAEFFAGKAEEVLPAWHEAHPEEKIDLIITDPPRKGCDSRCLETMLRMKPERIVYVSCDPATMARDLKELTAGGYALRKVCPVDQFPYSVHVETVCLLVLRNTVTHINIDVDVEELVQDKRGQATYEQIRDYVKEQTGLHVTNLNIAQIKRKCGIIERENYNLPKSEDSKQPNCTKEKEDAILDAFRHFGMI